MQQFHSTDDKVMANIARNPTESKIISVQVLRGIAAVIVAIYHLRDLATEAPFKPILNFFFGSGAAGVNLFFIISGFIMVYITRDADFTRTSIYRFSVKRLIRIWPTYIIITILFAVITYGFQLADRQKELILSLLFVPLATANPPFYGYSMLPVGWSLNYEIYFYALIAISMAFSRLRWVIFFVLIFTTLILVPITIGKLSFAPDRTYDYGNVYLNLITNPIIWNFIYGVIIGLLYTNRSSFIILSSIFSYSWIVSTAVILAIWQYLSGFFGGHGPLQWGAGTGVLFLAVIFYKSGRPIQYPVWLIELGNMSFSVYLLHLPVRALVENIFLHSNYPSYAKGTPAFFLTFSMTIILSRLSYHFLELRLSSFVKSLFPGFGSR